MEQICSPEGIRAADDFSLIDVVQFACSPITVNDVVYKKEKLHSTLLSSKIAQNESDIGKTIDSISTIKISTWSDNNDTDSNSYSDTSDNSLEISELTNLSLMSDTQHTKEIVATNIVVLNNIDEEISRCAIESVNEVIEDGTCHDSNALLQDSIKSLILNQDDVELHYDTFQARPSRFYCSSICGSDHCNLFAEDNFIDTALLISTIADTDEAPSSHEQISSELSALAHTPQWCQKQAQLVKNLCSAPVIATCNTSDGIDECVVPVYRLPVMKSLVTEIVTFIFKRFQLPSSQSHIRVNVDAVIRHLIDININLSDEAPVDSSNIALEERRDMQIHHVDEVHRWLECIPMRRSSLPLGPLENIDWEPLPLE